MKKLKIIVLCFLSIFLSMKGYASTIFVPRQLSYNPIFENALVCSSKVYNQDRFSHIHKFDHAIISLKPIYTQNVGSKFGQYFSIDNKSVLDVQENGTGDIGSEWFNVQAPGSTNFYSSELSFNPRRRTLGIMLYASVNFAEHFSVSANTALINTRNNMNIYESGVAMLGQEPGFRNMKQAFAHQDLQYGAIRGTQSKSGFDDIQIKLIYHSFATQHAHYDSDSIDMYDVSKSINTFYKDKHKHSGDRDKVGRLYYEAYLLAGIPTGDGSQAQYLFEPLVGSNHAQIGLGGNMHYNYGKWKFQAEAKWRYAFAADEMRSFDLTQNGQWSRYLQVVNSLNKYVYYPAINNFTCSAKVTPQNSFDFYMAAYWDTDYGWHCELGYDFWIRQAEKISVSPVLPIPSIGIADLPGIIKQVPPPQSASTATISQQIAPGENSIASDLAFVSIQPTDFNLNSAGAPKSISNSIYGTIGHTKELMNHLVRTSFSLAYECGHGVNVPNNISVFINMDVSF